MVAAGTIVVGRRVSFAQEATPAVKPANLDLPRVTVVVDDKGFAPPSGATAGRVLMTVENRGSQPLHFFTIRVPDEISDTQLESDLASSEAEPSWFDMTKLPMLGNPDWPAPGGQAQGVVDVTAGRWVLVDPIGGRNVAVWTVGDATSATPATAPAADVDVELLEMDFRGLEQPVPAGPRVWQIANRGALEHELALLPVSPGTAKEKVIQMITDMLQGKGDPNQFTPVGGQGIASKGVTSWQFIDLAPGTYAAVCMSPAPGEDFAPHALLGMVTVFTVQ
jgi:hypothetical protein